MGGILGSAVGHLTVGSNRSASSPTTSTPRRAQAHLGSKREAQSDGGAASLAWGYKRARRGQTQGRCSRHALRRTPHNQTRRAAAPASRTHRTSWLPTHRPPALVTPQFSKVCAASVLQHDPDRHAGAEHNPDDNRIVAPQSCLYCHRVYLAIQPQIPSRSRTA